MASALARICRFARSAALEALVRFEAPEHLRAAHHRFAALFFSWFDQFVIWLVKKSVYNVLGKEKGCIFAARNAWIWPGVFNRLFFMGGVFRQVCSLVGFGIRFSRIFGKKWEEVLLESKRGVHLPPQTERPGVERRSVGVREKLFEGLG